MKEPRPYIAAVRATMIIYHEPDLLEFAADGVSLGAVRAGNGETLFRAVRQAPQNLKSKLIQDTFDNLLGAGKRD